MALERVVEVVKKVVIVKNSRPMGILCLMGLIMAFYVIINR